jgi:amidophosphoribosyltransferase
MDFPSRQELIANHYHDAQSIGQAIGVDSLGYLSVEGLLDSVPCQEGIGYCTACFTGDYPVEVELDIGKYSTEE